MLSNDQIKRELKAIEEIDKIYFKEANHSVRDLIGYDSRQERRKKLLTMAEIQTIENSRER